MATRRQQSCELVDNTSTDSVTDGGDGGKTSMDSSSVSSFQLLTVDRSLDCLLGSVTSDSSNSRLQTTHTVDVLAGFIYRSRTPRSHSISIVCPSRTSVNVNQASLECTSSVLSHQRFSSTSRIYLSGTIIGYSIRAFVMPAGL